MVIFHSYAQLNLGWGDAEKLRLEAHQLRTRMEEPDIARHFKLGSIGDDLFEDTLW